MSKLRLRRIDRRLRGGPLLDQIRPRRLSCRLDRIRRSPCLRVPYAPHVFSYSAPPCFRPTRHRRTGGMYGAPRALHASDHGSRRDGAVRTGPAPQRSAIGPFRRPGATIPQPARRPAPRNTRGGTRLPSSEWGRDALQAKSTAAPEAPGSAIRGSCRPITVVEAAALRRERRGRVRPTARSSLSFAVHGRDEDAGFDELHLHLDRTSR